MILRILLGLGVLCLGFIWVDSIQFVTRTESGQVISKSLRHGPQLKVRLKSGSILLVDVNQNSMVNFHEGRDVSFLMHYGRLTGWYYGAKVTEEKDQKMSINN